MIYGYIRVSTDKQTTENQRFEIENFAKDREIRVEEWIEETISGTKKLNDRKFGALLQKISNSTLSAISITFLLSVDTLLQGVSPYLTC